MAGRHLHLFARATSARLRCSHWQKIMPKIILRIACSAVLLLSLALVALFEGCSGVGGSTGGGPQPQAGIDVLTYHNDHGRTGLNPNETLLTPANVNPTQFGKLFSVPVDGFIFGQPLYMQNVSVPGHGMLNLVFVVTEHDSAYAFDADGNLRDPVWKASFLQGGATTVSQAEVGSTIFPEIGITSTPVIDPATNTIYVEALTKEHGAFFQRLHALDVTDGHEKFGGPVEIKGSVQGTGDASSGGTITFDPKIQLQRSALLLNNGVLYVAMSSHGDNGPYHGWVMAYDAATLQQRALWCVTPDANAGAILMSGSGLAADSSGAIYGGSGNGNFNANSGGRDYADSVLKLSADLGSVLDYFTPFDQHNLAANDIDIGSGGVILLPDQPGAHPHLAIATNKGGNVYVVDRDNLGHFNPKDNSQIIQYMPAEIGTGAEDQNFSTPAYWNGFVYFVGAFDHMKAYQLANGLLPAAPASQSGNTFGFQGSTPVVSSNGNTAGIVWAIDQSNGGILHAYDATDLSKELWNSNQNAGRDKLGSAIAHFIVPTVVNGHVYVGTKSSLVAYGTLSAQ